MINFLIWKSIPSQHRISTYPISSSTTIYAKIYFHFVVIFFICKKCILQYSSYNKQNNFHCGKQLNIFFEKKYKKNRKNKIKKSTKKFWHVPFSVEKNLPKNLDMSLFQLKIGERFFGKLTCSWIWTRICSEFSHF